MSRFMRQTGLPVRSKTKSVGAGQPLAEGRAKDDFSA